MSHPTYKDIGAPVTRVIEECSELVQALCKADRFGWFNYHPDRPDSTNFDDVRREMDDVLEAMNKLDIHMRDLMFERFKDANKPTSNAPAQPTAPGAELSETEADCGRGSAGAPR